MHSRKPASVPHPGLHGPSEVFGQAEVSLLVTGLGLPGPQKVGRIKSRTLPKNSQKAPTEGTSKGDKG